MRLAENGGSYDFVVEKKGEGLGYKDVAWPSEFRFWDDLMYNSSQWGLFMYEQAWLATRLSAGSAAFSII